jgi:hypothetical protein
MKKLILTILIVIAAILVFKVGYFLYGLVSSFGNSNSVDTSKITSKYFIGDYQTDYRKETEKITLKENGFYDYTYSNGYDTTINNAGKWEYHFYNKAHLSIELSDFPLTRKNPVFEESNPKIDISLDVNTSPANLGNLFTVVGENEDNYTFVKLDKSSNKDYIIK